MTGGEDLQPPVLVLAHADETLVNLAAGIHREMPNDRGESRGEMCLRVRLDKSAGERDRLQDLGQGQPPIFELGQGGQDAYEAEHIRVIAAEVLCFEILAVGRKSMSVAGGGHGVVDE